jgi:ADP-ribose pyrophosphatase YjhB (NUDIX family)
MSNREYPERPLVGVGGVVIEGGRVLLVRRGSEPLRGEWSIPGGLLECGETLVAAVERELREETSLTVRVVELIEALDRIFPDALAPSEAGAPGRAAETMVPGSEGQIPKPRYHYVILDYLCEWMAGDPRAGGDASEIALVREGELHRYALPPQTLRVLTKAFAMMRARRKP